jgi:hypothetical protein
MASRGNRTVAIFLVLLLSSGMFMHTELAYGADIRREQERVCLDSTCFERQSGTSGLSLIGVAHFRYWGFRVYSAGLYADPDKGPLSFEQIGQREVELKLTYYRAFEPEEFVSSGESLMRENKEISFESISRESSRFNELYRSVKPGDTYAIHFTPGKGVSLKLNDTHLGTVEGDLFGRAYLGVWLSKKSISEKFTRQILDPERVRGGGEG